MHSAHPPSQQPLTGYTLQAGSAPNAAPAGVPQRFILSPDMQARLPSGEVVSIGQLASLANRQGSHQASQGSKPVTFQIQGNKLTLAGAQVRQVAVGQPRQVQGNMVHLVSTGGHHIIGQPAQLALIQAMAQQNAQPAVGVQASLQTIAGAQSAIPGAAAASPGLTVPFTATQVPGSVVTSSSVMKIVVRQAPKEGFPLAVHSPRPIAVTAARFPATVVTPARVQLPVGALTLASAHLPPVPRPVLRVVHTPAVNAEQAAPTVTRLVVAGPTLSEKEDVELPTLRPVMARPPAAPTEPLTSSTSLAALRPRRHLAAPPTKSPFKLEALEEKRRRQRQERLDRIVTVNERRCAASPVYGTELLRLCVLAQRATERPPEAAGWRGLGYTHCLSAQLGRGDCRPDAYWRTTRALDRAVRNPEERIEELADIIDRFIFVIPPVEAPAIQIHVPTLTPPTCTSRPCLQAPFTVSSPPGPLAYTEPSAT
ncbi:E1A-binding protein p400-like [Cetorhinus maximus]